MRKWLDRLGRGGRFLWSGWAGLAALALLAAIWQLGHEAYGDFILPAPATVLASVGELLSQPENRLLIGLTVRRAIEGFLAAALAGGLLGLVAGYFPACLRLARPFITFLLGVPPIAWIVLAMIWFGASDATVAFTILIAASPLVFMGVAEGIMTRDRRLDAMARVFGAHAWKRLSSLTLRHVAAHLFPALVLTLGTAFKVAVMAELLANVGGIGGELARSRANLDVSAALAWILISVAALIVVEYGIVHPVRAEFERWRVAARPWGIKR